MATQTTNYGFVKPALTDAPPDITLMNPNWDKIDTELKKKYDADNKPTAQDVGARPNTWMPSASDVRAVQRDIFWYNPDVHSTNLCSYIWSLIGEGFTSGVIQVDGDLPRPNDIPTSVTDKIGTYYICKFQKHGYGYVEVELYGDGVMSSYKNRTMIGTDTWMTNWVESFNPNGYLPLTGGKENPLTNSIYVSNGYTTLFGGDTGSSVAHFPDKNDTTNGALFELKGGLSNLKGAFNFVKRINGAQTIYAIYGEHNKPSGSYTGNGSATSRTINVGGIGEILVITSDIGTAWVSSRGAICMHRETGAVSGLKSWECYYKNGTLTIAVTSDFVNKSSQSYWYQVL